MVCLLTCQGRSLGAPLPFPQLSHILVLGRRAQCWQMGCSVLECILCCVSPDLPLHTKRNIIPGLPFASTHHAEPSPRDQPVCLATCVTEQCSA